MTSGDKMKNNMKLLLVLSMMLLFASAGTALADEKINITFVYYQESAALSLAATTNDYSQYMNYTAIPAFNSSWYASESLLNAVDSGFLETQDIILFEMVGQKVYKTPSPITGISLNESLKKAHDGKTSLLSVKAASSTPTYFDFISTGAADEEIFKYYSNMGTSGKGLENAQNLLIFLAKEYGKKPSITDTWGKSASNSDKYLFILGTDTNRDALALASATPDIAMQLNITLAYASDISTDFEFSDYGVIFIESQNATIVSDQWKDGINKAKGAGSKVIMYNMPHDLGISNVDLYTNEYSNIERSWLQGGQKNMENMLRTMGQKFTGLWIGKTYEPVIIQERSNLTYIVNSDQALYYMNQVISERQVLRDLFNIRCMPSTDALNISDFTKEDVIILYMVGANDFPPLKAPLYAAKDAGVQIGMFGMLDDTYPLATFDISSPKYNAMSKYLHNGGYKNMEHWVRFTASSVLGTYIESAIPSAPLIPDDGIYHPEAFPRIFSNSTEYLEWYVEHGFNASAPTIGIIGGKLGKTRLDYNTEDAIIRDLENKGYNVIYTTYKVCETDMDCLTKDGIVLVDSIISLKGFYLNYNDQKKGVEYLKKYNVPVLKGIMDYYFTPEQYLSGLHGLSPTSIPYQVTQPEIDGLIDDIWIAGRVKDATTGQYYYVPIESQLNWLCDRAIAWANLKQKSNADKRISIIYYNHEGGKSNIGASYLDIGSSFTLLISKMKEAGYNVGDSAIPNGDDFIKLFIESRNTGTWAPGELKKVVESQNAVLLPADAYLAWYASLPQAVRDSIESKWGQAPGNVMMYENSSGQYFVLPALKMGNIYFMPQPTRAWLSDESATYHDKSLPPTHQYLAFYFWVNEIFDADAIIHFGTHGTQEWLPGKEVGLDRYDYPSIMVADTPVIYPYIMDNVGEGTQAKRRGNAVIIDHMTPVITDAGIYGELAEMHDKIHNFELAMENNQTALMQLYRDTIIGIYDDLSMEHDIGMASSTLYNMSDSDFHQFLDDELHNYLHELQSTVMPLGLHVFGQGITGDRLVSMVNSMLRGTLQDNVYSSMIEDTGSEEEKRTIAEEHSRSLLSTVILNGTNISDAQFEAFGKTSDAVTAELEKALIYAENLKLADREISQTLRALNSEYIEPGTGNDPIRNPDALPTGRNFYSFDQRMFPDLETEAVGTVLAQQMLDSYFAEHARYPDKVSFVLWSVETMRHRGMVEAQIYAMLGVKPIRSSGRLTGFTVIPQEQMTHPRIDVVLVPSGLYRDTFPYQLELMDTAIRQIAVLDESNETNFVRYNYLKIERDLLEKGYNESTARYISQSRIFSEAPGAYGTGMSEAAAASDTWDNDTKLANLFISRMSNIYGKDVWGDNFKDVFIMNMAEVDAAVHSDSSNLYGLIDNDDYFSYLGGIALTVRSLTGVNPDMYVTDLKNVANPRVITLNDAFRNELRARYLNPKWVSGMMEFDYAGAREMMKFVEYMWGWDAMTPDLVKDSDWNQIHDVYVSDKYDLGLKEYFKENPYQYQSMTARMLETARKDYWKASDECLQTLVKEYVESVEASGVTCCHHTCSNILNREFVDGIAQALVETGKLEKSSLDAYRAKMEEATGKHVDTSEDNSNPPVVTSSSSRSNSAGPKLTITEVGQGNQTSVAGVGQDMSIEAVMKSPSDSYIEGYEMVPLTDTKSKSSSFSFSGSDVVALIFVLLAVSVVYLGFWRKR